MPDVDGPEARNPFSGPRADLGRRAEATNTIIIGVAVVAGLYFGREVLVPMSIAILLSFVLAPVTDVLSRLRIGRVASALIAVALAFAILGILGAIIGRQAAQLSESLPAYQIEISKKLDAVRSSAFGARMVEKAADALHGLENNIGKNAVPAPPQSAQGQATQAPNHPLVQVEVHERPVGPVQILQSVLSALLPPLATAAIVIIFVVFILLQRRDLRDRFIGLIGSDDLHRTTKALDDAAQRLSRYFLALTGINASFGIIIGLGLSCISVPNPILWGIAGAVLRFVPYAGAFIAAAIPLALAAAVDPGWSMVAETALLFVVVEGIMGQVVEPQLFGHTTGMSPLAIIAAAGFWTLIWGTPGLLLSTPITACLVVLGRHVESLNFIELLLGDKPPLSPVQSFYQRILASDPDEVIFQAESLLKDLTLIDYYEQVALPGLALAQIDVCAVLWTGAGKRKYAPPSRASSPIFPTTSTWPTKRSRKLPLSSKLRLQQNAPRPAPRYALLVVRRLIRRRAQSWRNSSNESMFRRASSVQTPYQSAGWLASIRMVRRRSASSISAARA
jgi:predicted PurR-regulated permease PerM